MQKTCQLQKTFNKNLEQCVFFILLKGAQTLTFMDTISIQKPLSHINKQGFGMLLVLFCFFWGGLYNNIWSLNPQDFLEEVSLQHPINISSSSKFGPMLTRYIDETMIYRMELVQAIIFLAKKPSKG